MADIAPEEVVLHDAFGSVTIPAGKLHGAQTARAMTAFGISTVRYPDAVVEALVTLKGAAARANGQLGLLEPDAVDAIRRAGAWLLDNLATQIVVDIYQTGSGTQLNMNVNEVIARYVNEVAPASSEVAVHPNDHVNLGQSSNDIVPTALHLASYRTVSRDLLPAMQQLIDGFAALAERHDATVKLGRTHLRDAVPMTHGQELSGFAACLARARRLIADAAEGMLPVPLGGTAVGTGLGTHPEFADLVCRLVGEEQDAPLRPADNRFAVQGSVGAIVHLNATLATVATEAMKIANDLRWLSSGPRSGLAELRLGDPPLASSIMPGKTNPVLAEALVQVCARVLGNAHSASVAGQQGNLQLNHLMPLLASVTLESVTLLASALGTFASGCVEGITVTGAGAEYARRSPALATALARHIGYNQAAALVLEAIDRDESVREVAERRTDLSPQTLDEALDVQRLAQPHARAEPAGGST